MKYVLNGRLTVKQETKSNTNISECWVIYFFNSKEHFKNYKKILNLSFTV